MIIKPQITSDQSRCGLKTVMLRRTSYQQDSFLLVVIVVVAFVIYQQNGGIFTRRAHKKIRKQIDELQFETKWKKLNFQSFSSCKLRPEYIKGYKVNCFYVCRTKGLWQACQPRSDQADRSHKACLSNYNFIGVEKSGADQITEWFKNARNPDLVLSRENFWPSGTCPDAEIAYNSLFNKGAPKIISKSQLSLNIGPHNLLANKKMEDTKAKLSVQTVVQILGYMRTPQSRYHIQLRHPTDRMIEQLIDWHEAGLIYSNTREETLTGEIIHHIVTQSIEEFQDCLKSYNELVCFYSSEGREGDLKALLRHSLYVLLLETAFKFIPRPQLLITKTPETDAAARETIEKTFAFYDQSLPTNLQELTAPTQSVINPDLVFNKTIQALDDFFSPYNKRLAHLLRSKQWLFQRQIQT